MSKFLEKVKTMKTLTLEQMQLAGGNCKNIWRTLGVTIPSSMVGGSIVGAIALGVATGGAAAVAATIGYAAGAIGGLVICRLSTS